ncbi:putative Mitochondrial carrier protein [Trypanosoma vivax]|uniref:Putative mitochondrial carrier protein n=1 Tax=Trypanosoma vivax (strain Y486) TaxID=1055687 RepID=G0U399_TRYVY|nr:putative carrier protein [Trypanosoma vivax]KAH8604132.1 putative Mitochondrial carrier protein [Trypanosoma vivax]CCC50755.1 putative mitochondrial carrier protein [Trypanosoma vivax Y486]
MALSSSQYGLQEESSRLQRGLPSPLLHAAAGVIGGSLATVMFYPLDFIRTRMHVCERANMSVSQLVRQVVSQEGICGVYRGVSVAVASHGIGWGMYLLTFRAAQEKLAPLCSRGREMDGDQAEGSKKGVPVMRNFLSACLAALVTGTAITPLHLLKTRRQLLHVIQTSESRGFRDDIRRIVHVEGWGSLLRGCAPQMILTGNTTIQVTMYEGLKWCFVGDRGEPSSLEVALMSVVSRATATAIFNPFEVVRTRLQDTRNTSSVEYRSMRVAFQTIWRIEGLGGLYRGLPVNVCRVIPTTAISFMVYEKSLTALTTMYSLG